MNLSACEVSIAAKPQALHRQLVKLVGQTVADYRDDLLVHDAACISRMTKCEFVHVSYCHGTHLFELPQKIVDDASIPYLFGKKRPSAIYLENLDLLSRYFGRYDYFGYQHVFSHCDGIHVRIVSQEEAVSIYRTALRKVLDGMHVGCLPA